MRACYRERALYSLVLVKEAFYAEISVRLRTHTPPFPLELGRYRVWDVWCRVDCSKFI
ncbi:MAG: hypothetical protein MW690_000768 [Methanophagales archaeon]|nr:hypothetical protein [Methanophagales archaeon]